VKQNIIFSHLLFQAIVSNLCCYMNNTNRGGHVKASADSHCDCNNEFDVWADIGKFANFYCIKVIGLILC
jgi:hypothetical protein